MLATEFRRFDNLLFSFAVFWKTDFILLILQIIFFDSARTTLLIKTIHELGRSILIFICKLNFVSVPCIFSLCTLIFLMRFFSFALRMVLLGSLHMLIILNVFYEYVVVLENTLFTFSVLNLLHGDLAVSFYFVLLILAL